MSLLSDEQLELLREANKSLQKAFPLDGIQVVFNLSPKHSNLNYNIKASGIDGKK